MRLISLHVENFGKLNNFNLDFDHNPYIILEDNGWGKSTLAAFIKVMFYGFSGENKRSSSEKERERYRPWNKGLYGGSIVFSTKNGKYELSKVFGAREKDDSCMVCDADTRLVIQDIDASRLGEELFSLDERSFLRSVFIAQNDIKVHENQGDDIADGISAKIGNLSDATDDVNRYESVMDRINDILNKMSPKRATGTIKQADVHIYGLNNDIRQEDSLITAIDDLEGKITSERLRLKEYEQERNELEDLFRQNALKGELLARRESFQRLWKEYEADKEELDKMSEKFANGLPSLSDVDSHLAGWNERNSLLSEINAEQIKLEYMQKEQENERIRKAEEEKLKAEEKTLFYEKMLKRRKLAILFLILFAVFLGAAAAIYLMFSDMVLGCAACAAGLIFLIAGLILMPYKFKKSDYEELWNEGISDETDNPETVDVNDNSPEIDNLVSKIGADKDRAAIIEVNIKEFLRHYMTDFDADHAEQGLYDIKQEIHYYESGLEALEKKRREIKEFENANDMTAIMNADISKDPEIDYDEAIERNAENIKETQNAIRHYETSLKDLYERLGDISEKKEELKSLSRSRDEDMHFYEMLTLTRDYLKGAKDNFSAKYRKPLLDGFKKYYGLLSREEMSEFQIDARINMTKREMGEARGIENMSSGNRDLCDICLRMALVDAMYTDEKPFLIFDDPFVNLDMVRTGRALSFLNEVGKNYQVIYFTCHESRA